MGFIISSSVLVGTNVSGILLYIFSSGFSFSFAIRVESLLVGPGVLGVVREPTVDSIGGGLGSGVDGGSFQFAQSLDDVIQFLLNP